MSELSADQYYTNLETRWWHEYYKSGMDVATFVEAKSSMFVLKVFGSEHDHYAQIISAGDGRVLRTVVGSSPISALRKLVDVLNDNETARLFVHRVLLQYTVCVERGVIVCKFESPEG